ncbi:MAG: homoserine dehydrogenase [Bacteroidetes bacterium]|nr:homoserine dehydrogenase [Bacteroidota bacterium]
MSQNKLSIGLFGFGCVGKGIYDLLQTDHTIASIKKIVVKSSDKKRPLNTPILSFDPNDILNDPEINLVIELIDDAKAAFTIVTSALKKGKAVISANKKMIAENFRELVHLQKKFKTPFLYEASCGASIPVIRNLEEYYKCCTLQSIEGIVNSSTNFILSRALEQNSSFQIALKEAQELGYAESDPSLDTEGLDAAYKLSILTSHAFGKCLDATAIFRVGINQLRDIDFEYARREKYKIKLVAFNVLSKEGKLCGVVAPKFIPPHHPFYQVDDVLNGVLTKAAHGDVQFFSGKGAGALPTASAVLSDIAALYHNYTYSYIKFFSDHIPLLENSFYLNIFISFPIEKREILQYRFLSIDESFSNQQVGYITGVISIKELWKLKCTYDDISIIIFDLHHEDIEENESREWAFELQNV